MPREGRISVRKRIGPGRYQTTSYTPWEYRRLLEDQERAERAAQQARERAARLAAMTPEERRAEEEREARAAAVRGWGICITAVLGLALVGYLVMAGAPEARHPTRAPAAELPEQRFPRNCRTLLLGTPTPETIAKYDRCIRRARI